MAKLTNIMLNKTLQNSMLSNTVSKVNEGNINQQHLNYNKRINLGSYYTQNQFVDMVWQVIKPYLTKKSVILDSSCGYGNFLKNDAPYKQIGSDIDEMAIKVAMKKSNIIFHTNNALSNTNRHKYNIKQDTHLCIIGNPPYNDRTSIIRSGIKCSSMPIDKDILTRDLGMSFLLSYQKLSADIVCVLHPLSYLIKRSNFNLIKKFTNEYQLINGKIISSGVFKDSSKSMQFPIVIALYKKSNLGTSYQDIINFNFEVSNNKTFSLSQFDSIGKYVKKYPSKYQKPNKNDILFWTLRDINALKRNQTFIKKHSANTIIINQKQLDYYIYIDVFKHFSKHIPYYFGNCDVLIDNDLFLKYKKYFILECLSRYKDLRQYFATFDKENAKTTAFARQKIDEYFRLLLKEHYVY